VQKVCRKYRAMYPARAEGAWWKLAVPIACTADRTCFICTDEPPGTYSVLLPCRHAGACVPCIAQWVEQHHKCPMCREPVTHIAVAPLAEDPSPQNALAWKVHPVNGSIEDWLALREQR
jgi:hypothetical protein